MTGAESPDLWTGLSVIVAAVLGAVGKTGWDRRSQVPQNPQSAKPFNAKNGFMTAGDIAEHCKDQQQVIMQLMRSEFKVIETKLDARLDHGEDQFKAIDIKLAGIMRAIKNGGSES